MITLRTRSVSSWIILLALVATALACGPLSGLQSGLQSGGQAPTPTLMSLPPAGGGNATGGDDAPLTFTDADKSGLTSFRAKFTLSYNGTDESGNPVQGSFSMDQAHTTNPAATSLKWKGDSNTEGGTKGNFEMVQIGEATYIISSEGGSPKCISMTSSGSNPSQTAPASPDTFLTGSDLTKARRILPDELVNGVLARHYQFTKTEVTLGYSEWSNYTVDVWNAVDGNYTVKATFSGDGKDLTFKGGQGHVEWTHEVTEINTVPEIMPPAGCEPPAGADFPKMPDATDVTSFGDITTYTSASSLADVVAFYNAQLPALGWVAGTANTDTPGFATLEFTKDSKKASITITESDGKTTVLISIQ